MPNPPGLLSSILEYQEGLCFFCRRPLPFDLKVQLMADKLFMGGITRWCQTASARPDHAADLPHVPPYGGAAAGGWHGQTASHVVHHDKPSHDTPDDPSCSLFLTE